MRVYLAGRFDRREELAGYARELEAEGIRSTARWLNPGAHAWSGVADADIPDAAIAAFAQENLEDIGRSDVFVLFTERPEIGYQTGGRHVEAGYAIARKIPRILVGPRENIFYAREMGWLRLDDWAEAQRVLRRVREMEPWIRVPS